MLCSACNRLAICSFHNPADESFDRRYEEAEFYEQSEYVENRFGHRDDIFQVRDSADGGCELCDVIVTAFKGRKLEDEQAARGLPIVFTMGNNNKLKVSFESPEELIPLCSFDLYMPRDLVRVDSKIPPGFLREMQRDPGSEGSLKLAASWLDGCVNNHAKCSPTMPEYRVLPKRVLNVGNEEKVPFLVEPSAAESLNGRWAALSYCWGGEPSMKLTTDNIGDLKHGIPLTKFDATIRDAILVTRALGLTYLWVDALCISQDPDCQDWNEQSSKMSAIYGDSAVTIVAADSTSVKQGFLKERKLQYIPVSWLPQGLHDGENLGITPRRIYLSPSWKPLDDEVAGPWATRGWTMQEGLLPNRLLHYTSSQMIWKCCEVLECERGFRSEMGKEAIDDVRNGGVLDIWNFDNFSKFKILPWYLGLTPSTHHFEGYRLWYALVEDYTPRRFKHIQDRLVAISGFARAFGDLIGEDAYVVGLWKRDLVRGLAWHVRGAKLISSPTTQIPSAPVATFPSWTWASAGYATVVNDHAGECFKSFCVVEDVQLDFENPSDPFSGARGGSITITGPVFALPRLYNKQWRCNETPMSALERFVSNVVEKESVGDVEEKFSSPGGRFIALQMLQHLPSMDLRLDLLILEDTGGTSKGKPTYRRVGLLTIRYLDSSFLASPELVEVIKKAKTSLPSRLGSPIVGRSRKLHCAKEVFMEMKAKPWPRRTIVIV